MPPRHTNSLDKIVEQYLAGVTAEVFTYHDQIFSPREITVSPLVFRPSTCPVTCGACCMKFSHVWLPNEPHSETATSCFLEFNGHSHQFVVDTQEDNQSDFCHALDMRTARCGIYEVRPFTCDFELLRFKLWTKEPRCTIACQPFGRAFAMTRVTGQKKAMCDMLPITEESVKNTTRKFERLKAWSDHLGLQTQLPTIIEWCSQGPHTTPLHLRPGARSLLSVAEHLPPSSVGPSS